MNARLRHLLCRHRDTWGVRHVCGCSYEWCRCGARRDDICDEHVRFVGYKSQTIGRWP